MTGLMLLLVTTLLPAGAAARTAPAASAPAAVAHPTAAPDVQPIDSPGYLRLVSSMKGHPLVVNVWATWCDPCREEFPDIVRFHREMGPRGVEVAAISLDMPSALKTDVVPFLAANGATFHLFLKTPGGDEEFINTVDPGWSGALPATFVYDREGKLVRSVFGSTSFEQLGAIVAPLLPAAPK
ncbi:MAG TPA: TlpA disulfide reductase family protein [Patescibacteria group bacterium]|nr:TlpA disulfide reductase family protein [Patescibacteria group bacterium]